MSARPIDEALAEAREFETRRKAAPPDTFSARVWSPTTESPLRPGSHDRAMSTNGSEVVCVDLATTATSRDVVAADELPALSTGPSRPCPS